MSRFLPHNRKCGRLRLAGLGTLLPLLYQNLNPHHCQTLFGPKTLRRPVHSSSSHLPRSEGERDCRVSVSGSGSSPHHSCRCSQSISMLHLDAMPPPGSTTQMPTHQSPCFHLSPCSTRSPRLPHSHLSSPLLTSPGYHDQRRDSQARECGEGSRASQGKETARSRPTDTNRMHDLSQTPSQV